MMTHEKAVLQKLKSKAKSKGLSFQLILQLFCQEEFLRRLSRSNYKARLILKGGLFLFSYSGFESRPTMDVDLLAKGLSNDRDVMTGIIKEICNAQTENEYIKFDIKNSEKIAEIKAYHGVRVKIVATIANTKTPFDVDIGIGDVIVPKENEVLIQTQLDDFESPKVVTYSLESTIAEKLEAMFDRMEANSRMKDYFDIYYLASHYDFDGKVLKEAIQQTFEKRQTVCDIHSFERIVSMKDHKEMVKRWYAFSKKSLGTTLEFDEILKTTKLFLHPIIIAIENNNAFEGYWRADMEWFKQDR